MLKKYLTPINLLIVLIFIACLILRFWRVRDYFVFGIDEEYHAFIAKSIVRDFHVIWIGANAGNTGFYLGPGFIYLNALLFWFSQGDPLILGYFAGFIGVITVISLYLIVRSLFNQETAIKTMIIYGLSTFAVYFDRRFWNPTFVPIITCWLFFSFVKSLKNPNWLILTAILTAISFHVHFSLIVFVPLILAQIYLIKKRAKEINLKLILISLTLFLLIYSPLVVYDFVHNFDNLKTPIRLLNNFGNGRGQILFITKINDLLSMLPQLFLMTNYSLVSLVFWKIITLVVLVYFYLRKKNQIEQILGLFSGVYLLSFLFYPGAYSNYYLLALLPLISIIAATFLNKINNRLNLLILALFIILNLKALLPLASSLEALGLTNRKKLINQACLSLVKKSYILETDQAYINYGGWSYLFNIYCKPPLRSRADEMFGWMYPNDISQKNPDYRVILSKKALKNIKAEKTFKINGITVYIVNNNYVSHL